MRCVFCGCDEQHACLIPVTDEMREQAAAAGVFRLPDVIGCSWISDDPPICSARICQLLEAAVATLVSTRPTMRPIQACLV